jgi:hypothetical protein
MYFSASSHACKVVPSEVYGVASNNMQYRINAAKGLKLYQVSPESKTNTGSVCRRAASVMWMDLMGQRMTDDDYKKEVRPYLHIYVTKKKNMAIIHLRNAPGTHWARSMLFWSLVGGKWSDFLRRANTFTPKTVRASPMIKLIKETSPYKPRQLKEMRMRILQQIVDKGFDWLGTQLSDLQIKLAFALDQYQSTPVPPTFWKDHFETGGEPWWWQHSPELRDWQKRTFKSKRLRVLNNTGVTQWVGKGLQPAELRALLSSATWMSGVQRVLFETIISNYFQENASLLPIHMNMDLSLLGVDNKDAAGEGGMRQQLLSSAIAGSGPFILKVLQQIGAVRGIPTEAYARGCTQSQDWLKDLGISGAKAQSEGDDGLDFVALTEAVFGRIPALSKAEMDFIRETMHASTPLFDKDRMVEEPIGSASLAEAHISRLDDGTEVILKFLRPMYAYYYLCEADFLLNSVWDKFEPSVRANFPDASEEQVERMTLQAQKLLMFLVSEFAGEFDYKKEFANMERGSQVYTDPANGVFSAEGIDVNTETIPYIVQTKAEGIMFNDYLTSLDKLSREEAHAGIVQAYKMQTRVYRLWVIETLIGSGFFHADMHGGNMMISLDGERITVIDYGSSGELRSLKQCQLIDSVLSWARLEDFSTLIVGTKLYAVSRLLLRERQAGGFSMGELRTALKGMREHQAENESPEVMSSILSELSTPWPSERCHASDRLSELMVMVRYQQGGSLLQSQRSQFRELVGMDEKDSPGMANLLLQFRSLPMLQPTQRRILLEGIRADEKSLLEKHRVNVKRTVTFIEMLETACEIKERSAEDRSGLARQMLDYGTYQTFADLFMEMILFASNIGKCTHNEILLFGRATAYVAGLNGRLYYDCNNVEDCPGAYLGKILMGPMIKRPKMWIQIANSKRARHTNCK